MTILERIKHDIEQLPFEQRAELMAWLHGWSDDAWDEQMKRDVAAGKLDDVMNAPAADDLRELDDLL
ncbi:MAG: hypothetical protein GC162_17700 [Planctomycetes bacterium]|nr:hypothetical protein [Planctomycetota bacterium]